MFITKNVKYRPSWLRLKSKDKYVLFSRDNSMPDDLEKLKVKIGKFISGTMDNVETGLVHLAGGSVQLKAKCLSRTNWVILYR